PVQTYPLFHFRRLFFNATPTTEIYTLSLHDALPISCKYSGLDFLDFFAFRRNRHWRVRRESATEPEADVVIRPQLGLRNINPHRDRKSTRLNSSHVAISYAVFCLKKKTRGDDPAVVW